MLLVLLLTLGGTTSSHQISHFSYDDRARTLQYTEAGASKTVDGIGPVSLTGQKIVISTDKIFANRFD